MRNKSIEKITVMEELEKIEKKLNEGSHIAWANFPYSESNLAVIRSTLKDLGLCHENLRISFDENDIFIEKDNFLVNEEETLNYKEKAGNISN
ncbi:MAG: hypothetical protein HVN35_06190 [Methanobacteriaceae archaeon]|nr:hypothetical protein [Methanobacteriaceae archaeon]